MINILGININTKPLDQVWREIVSQSHPIYITTPNPEIILKSHQDEEYFYILNQSNLAIADGFGIKLAGYLKKTNIPRITGADLTLKLLSWAEKENIKTIIINWEKGLSIKEDIDLALKNKYPKLNFKIIDTNKTIINQKLNKEINQYSPQLLFCTFGFPEQEKFIYHNLSFWSSIKIAIGVGGSFDFITKKKSRAPKIMRKMGLEWLWRLIISPKRIKRICNATFIFSIKLFTNFYINSHRYRPNVVCWLYKKEENSVKVLIVERRDEHNHWQLPQGGTEGESLEKAGRRELTEELNTNNFDTVATFKNLYRYTYNNSPTNPKKNIGIYKTGYKGQKQGLYIAKFRGNDKEIKVNFWDHTQFKWIDINELVSTVHISRKEATQIFLNKFKSLNII